MKEVFPEYYQQPDFDDLWTNAVFVFDANVLLDLYRLSPDASKELIEILQELRHQGRIWIPLQFAYEYHKNLRSVRNAVKGDYKTQHDELSKVAKSAGNALRSIKTRSGFRIEDSSVKAVIESIERITPELKAIEDAHLERLEKENLEEEIAQIFAGRVGDNEMDAIVDIGNERYERGIPPGNKDKDKSGSSDPFGDLVGWLQIIDYAGYRVKPIVLVTNDSKGDDWFEKDNRNEIIGPRPELVREMRTKTRQAFHIYRTTQFTKWAKKHLDIEVSDETIGEVERLGSRAIWLDSSKLTGYLRTNLQERRMTDLFSSHRSGLDFGGASLESAELTGAALDRANLAHANLMYATLDTVSLKRANLRGANLRGASLLHADFSGADLQDVDLEDGDLFDADFTGANLQGAKLRGLDLEHCHVRFADFRGAHLQDANLIELDLSNVLLEGAQLDGAVLRGATLPDGDVYTEHRDLLPFIDITHPAYPITSAYVESRRRAAGFETSSPGIL